jgi:hypothetical protein
MFGRNVAAAPFPGENVLPGATRNIEVEIGEGLGLGRYTARLAASYGEPKQFLAAETSFWVVPWKEYGPGVAVLAGMAAFLIRKRKNIKAAIRGFRDAE